MGAIPLVIMHTDYQLRWFAQVCLEKAGYEHGKDFALVTSLEEVEELIDEEAQECQVLMLSDLRGDTEAPGKFAGVAKQRNPLIIAFSFSSYGELPGPFYGHVNRKNIHHDIVSIAGIVLDKS